jgi:hypothetical protein
MHDIPFDGIIGINMLLNLNCTIPCREGSIQVTGNKGEANINPDEEICNKVVLNYSSDNELLFF